MSVIIQHKRGTASQWTTLNPTLAAGEVGWESDTNKFKIGTGSTAWNSLLYATLTPSGLSATYAQLVGGNAFTGAQTITSTATGQFPLTIIPATGQTVETFRIRNSANNADLLNISSGGALTINAAAGSTPYMNLPGLVTLGRQADNEINIRNLSQLRFESGNNWNYNSWAGLGFDSSNRNLYLGGPAGSANYFRNNNNAERVIFNLVGLSTHNSDAKDTILQSRGTNTRLIVRGKNQTATVSGVTANGTTVTYTTSSAHYMDAGDVVTITGVNPVAYNLTSVTIASVPSQTTFTVTNAATGTFVSGGTATVNQANNLTEWQNSAGSTLSAINSAGAFTGFLTRTNTGRTGLIDFITPGSSSQATWANYPVGLGTMLNMSQGSNGAPSNNFQYFFKVANRDFGGGWGGISIDYATGDFFVGRADTSSVYATWHRLANTSLANTFSGTQTIVSSSATAVPLISRGAANQLEDTLEIQNSSSTVLGGFNANAQIYSGSTIPLTTGTGGATTTTSGTGTVATVTTTSIHNLSTGDRVTVAGVTPTGYNGTFIVTGTPTTTSFTYNNTTTGSQTVAGTVSIDAQASIVARSAATTPLILRAAINQGVNMFRIEGSAGGATATIDAAGAASFVSGAIALTGGGSVSANGTINSAGSMRIGSTGATLSGTNVLYMASGTAPSASPISGGFLHVDSGALRYRGTSNPSTTIVNADGTIPIFSANNTFTGVQAFNNAVNIGGGSVGAVGLEIGSTLGSATTPFIDFHSGATAIDFDSRIIASGGNGTNGQGTLTYTAATNTFAGSINTAFGLSLTGTTSPITLNGSAGTAGQVLTSAGSGTTPTWSSSFISTTSSYFAGHNPEGRLMYNTYLTNDMANARLRGSAVAATQNGSAYTISNANWDAMFDGTATFFNISPTSGFTFPLVITVPLPRTLTYGAWVGLSFGSTTFRANSVTIEVFSLDSNSWVTVFTTTSNTSEDIFTSVSGLTNSNATGINQVRYTIAAPNSTQLRLQHLWAYNFNSDMWSQTMMPRAGGAFYGAIRNNNTLNGFGVSATPSAWGGFDPTVEIRGSSSSISGINFFMNGGPFIRAYDSSGNPRGAWANDGSIVTGPSNTKLGTLSVHTDATGTIGAVIRGASGQTANILEVQNNAATLLSAVTPAGRLYVQRQEGIQFMDGAATLRSRIYSSGNNGVYFDTGGGSVRVLTLDGGSEAITGTLINPYSAARQGLIIRGLSGQATNLQEWQTNTPTTVASVSQTGKGTFDVLSAPNGAFFGNITSQPGSPSAYLAVQGYSPQHRPLLVRGFGATTANLVDYQNGSSVVVGGRNGVGQIFTGSTAALNISTGGATTATSGDGTTATITTTSAHGLAVGDIVTVAGITPTGYNGTYSVASTPTTTTFTYSNTTTDSQTIAGTVRVDAQASITSRSAATVGLLVRAAASQVSNPFEVQNSSGVVIANISSSGGVRATGTLQGSTLSAVADGSTIATLSASGNVQFRGAASYGGGVGVIGIANATTAPTTDPTGGGILYVDTGALKYKGTSGTAGTIVNADGTNPLSVSPTFSTSIIGSASMDVFNTVSTTVNAFGAATSLNIGSSSSGNKTLTLQPGGSNGTSTINIGTGSVSTGSIAVNIGTATISSGSVTNTIGSSASTTSILGTVNISNPLLSSVSTVGGGGSEGGQINFAKTTDGTMAWAIDAFGTTATPDLRVLEGASERFRFVAGGALSVNGQAGSAGQVLTSQGSGTAPTWTAPASHTLIASSSFSSAPSFTSIPQTYKRLYVVIVFATLGTFSGALTYTVNGAGTGYSRFQPGVSTAFTTSAGAAAVLTLAATAPVVGDCYWVEINNYTQTNSRSIGNGSVYTFGNVIPAAVTSFAFAAATSWGGATGTAYLYGVN
jgi:hypothetical protein